MKTLASVVVTIFCVIIGNVLCGDISNNRQMLSSPWQNLNNKNTGNGTQTHTTPWPALGERPRQQSNHPSNNPISNNKQQSAWILPKGGTNWVRNTPSPNTRSQSVNQNTQNGNMRVPVSGSNYNMDFINREKDGNLNSNLGMKVTTNHALLPVITPKPVDNTVTKIPPNNSNLGVNKNQGTVNKTPNLSYANILGNSGNQGVRIPNPSKSNNGLPTIVSTGSTLMGNSDTVQNVAPNNIDNVNVDDYELREFSEELYGKDINNPTRHVTINLQGKTTSRSSRDEAPEPLLRVGPEAYRIPSIAKLMSMHNNYILEVNQNEVYTAQEKLEENDFLDTILPTPIMQHTRNFLVKKGKIGKDPKEFRDLLKLIWFGMYSRGGGRIGSSGFEHIFLAELKNNGVSGLHNWLYFNEEEQKRNANYLGYMKKVDLGNKGAILKYHFTFHDVDKPVGSMFIGTSPELEMALYSTCFILRADRICPLKMNGNKFIIRTYTYRYRGKNMIGSAFPEI